MKKPILVLILAVASLAGSAQIIGISKPEKPVPYAQVMPVYPGGEGAIKKFIMDHMEYPDEAKKNKNSDKAYLQFVVEKDGSTSSHIVLRGIKVCPQCGEEALKAIRGLKGFQPALQNGRQVRLSMTIPVEFPPHRFGSESTCKQRVNHT